MSGCDTKRLGRFKTSRCNSSRKLLFKSRRTTRREVSTFHGDLLRSNRACSRCIGLSPRPRASLAVVSRGAKRVGTLINNHKRGAAGHKLGHTCGNSAHGTNSAFGVLTMCTPTLSDTSLALTAARISRRCCCRRSLRRRRIRG